MGEPYLGEIKVVSFSFPPKGWAFCNGQLLQITQNQPLFSVIGNMYGGDGRVNFALPNFQGRIPVHQGAGFIIAEQGGENTHFLNISELPSHLHPPNAQSSASSGDIGTSPAGAIWATAPVSGFGMPGDSQMNPAAVQAYGGNQAHENQAPYLVLNFVIALQGIYPSQP